MRKTQTGKKIESGKSINSSANQQEQKNEKNRLKTFQIYTYGKRTGLSLIYLNYIQA